MLESCILQLHVQELQLTKNKASLKKLCKNIYHRIPRNSHCEVLVINDYKWINIQKLIDRVYLWIKLIDALSLSLLPIFFSL